MIVSWNWLTEYLRLEMSVEELTNRLALTGLNHESTEDVGGDLAIDLEVTSNRSDCLGHLGVAREIAVIFGLPPLVIKEPQLPAPAARAADIAGLCSVSVEAPDACPRFTARLISGVTVGESPWWLRKRLETLGVRPVNNIADITNYVMFERSQPLHAYDFDRLAGKRIVVRYARAGETLSAINQKKYALTPDMLVIADADRPVGLGGVMGGFDTEIGGATRNILIEAAHFDPLTIRRTARALNLFSPASYRFERPVDPDGTDWSSRRCAELILALAGGTLHEGVLDVGVNPPPRPAVALRFDQIERILGISIPPDRVIAILEALGLHRLPDGRFQSPSWRHDLEREIDLIEEVARIHGYEHIPEDKPVPLTSSSRGPRERVESAVREVLLGTGFDEACTYSLIPESLVVPLDAPGQTLGACLKVDHSSRKVETTLRPSLIPSLLAARKQNEAHGITDADLFEISQVYLTRPDRPLPDEPTRLAFVAGRDFFEIKGVLEALLSRLGIAKELTAQRITADHALFTPGRSALLQLDNRHLGYLGEVNPSMRNRIDMKKPCTAAELELGLLMEYAVLIPQAHHLSPFPAVTRDLSLVVDCALIWADLAATTRQAAGPYLERLEYLDAFQGGNLPPNRRSLHFGMTFRHPERTLKSEEIDQAVTQVINACNHRFQAALRT